MSNNIILTGPPRSGTTLACSLLNQIPNTAALHEPMNLNMFLSPQQAFLEIRDFFAAMRNSIIESGTALSKVKGESIPANPFVSAPGGNRESIVQKGILKFDKAFTADFPLIIKHNGHFTFLLPEIAKWYPVFVLLRHPVATIASWNTIQAPVAKGNLKVLEKLNPDLYAFLNKVPDRLERQVLLLLEMYNRYADVPASNILYYEELIQTRGSVLSNIVEEGEPLHATLKNKNHNTIYSTSLIKEIKLRMTQHLDRFLPHYSAEAIQNF
jgi:hypothetical protein